VEVVGREREDAVAVDHAAALVDEDAAIGVAVDREAAVKAAEPA